MSYAAENGHVDVVSLLLDKSGSTAMIADANGLFPEDCADRNGFREVEDTILRVSTIIQKEDSAARRSQGQSKPHQGFIGVGSEGVTTEIAVIELCLK